MPSFGVSTISPKNSSSFNMFSTSAIAFIRCQNRDHMNNHTRYKGNINNTSAINVFNRYITLVIFCLPFYVHRRLHKTLSDGTLLGRTFRSFLLRWLLLLLFSSLEVFTFTGYFSLPPALDLGFSGPWRPPAALSSTLATFGCFTFARLFCHSFTTSPTVLSKHFLPTSAFYLTLLPHIFDTFRDSDAGRNTQSRILLCSCLIELSLPDGAWTWTTHIVVTRPLIYQLCQWATKYRVKIKLLNMFRLFKIIWKFYKNTLNKIKSAA